MAGNLVEKMAGLLARNLVEWKAALLVANLVGSRGGSSADLKAVNSVVLLVEYSVEKMGDSLVEWRVVSLASLLVDYLVVRSAAHWAANLADLSELQIDTIAGFLEK